jgi:EAL domain-containing protein (putative c-di-GMP-specific phosphodiesterase class I)
MKASRIKEINADPVGTSIVCSVISMGKSLGQRVVAEGVETAAQVAFLQAQQCGEGQGYYFCRPLVAEQFAGLSTTGQSGVLQ